MPESREDVLSDDLGRTKSDQIELVEILFHIYKQRLLVGVVCILVTVSFIVMSFIVEERYRAEILISLAENENPQAVGEGLGLVGSLLLGTNALASNDAHRILATAQSRQFITTFTKHAGLEKHLFDDRWDGASQSWKPDRRPLFCAVVTCDDDQNATQAPTEEEIYKQFSKILIIAQDRETSLITASIDWRDPDLSADWTNAFIMRLNETLREKDRRRSQDRVAYYRARLDESTNQELRITIASLIADELKRLSLIDSRGEYALNVIDPARPPMTRVHPRRTVLAIVGVFVGLFLGLSVAAARSIYRMRSHEWRAKWTSYAND